MFTIFRDYKDKSPFATFTGVDPNDMIQCDNVVNICEF